MMFSEVASEELRWQAASNEYFGKFLSWKGYHSDKIWEDNNFLDICTTYFVLLPTKFHEIQFNIFLMTCTYVLIPWYISYTFVIWISMFKRALLDKIGKQWASSQKNTNIHAQFTYISMMLFLPTKFHTNHLSGYK